MRMMIMVMAYTARSSGYHHHHHHHVGDCDYVEDIDEGDYDLGYHAALFQSFVDLTFDVYFILIVI